MTTTPRPTNPLRLGRKARPTRKHRPAVWESMFGTVIAMNDAGETRYFDYDYTAAIEFAGVSDDRDLRVGPKPGPGCYIRDDRYGHEPTNRQPVLWVLR